MAVYEEGKYLEFTPTAIFSGDVSRYGVRFEEWDMAFNVMSYIPVSELPGDMTIVDKENNNAVLFTSTVTQVDNSIVAMQLSETEFMNLPEDTEPEPTDPSHTKVRFFYTGEYSDAEEVIINVYNRTMTTLNSGTAEPIFSLNLKKGELSDYTEIAMDVVHTSPPQKIQHYCEIIDAKTGEIISTKNVFRLEQLLCVSSSNLVPLFKKATVYPAAFMASFRMTPVESLSTRW